MDEQTRDAHNLAREFLDDEYRRTWAEDYLNTSLALQIAALRKEREWNQSILAAKAGTTQSAISRMEDVEYGAHSIRVLKQLADAFGLRLRVSFEEFGSLIAESGGFSEDGLHRKSFVDDLVIAQLLAEQGLSLPAAASAPFRNHDLEEPVIDTPAAGDFESFEDEFAVALFLPLEDRAKVFKKWLLGYGLPSAEEPAYMRLYFSIPPDARNGEWSRRAAEACAEWLRPELFAELLSDAIDGERAVLNLLRLSAALPAGFVDIAAACRQLLSWVGGEWRTLDVTVQEALIDLVLELRELNLVKVIFAWPLPAGLSNRQRLKISNEVSKAHADDPIVLENLAGSFDIESRRDRDDALVSETSNQIIERESRQLEADLQRNPRERIAIATVYISTRWQKLSLTLKNYALEFAPQLG